MAAGRGYAMEDYRSFAAEELADWDFPAADEPCMDLPPMIGADERRMHIRAYEMWLSLLAGRDYPASGDLDADQLGEFAPFSALLDFSRGRADPAIAYLGSALREEGDIGADVATVADVPSRALLARLTEHYAEILDNRAPVGFEAEFINRLGHPILYRGILMPYSSDGEQIDLIHGVVNWKEGAGAALSSDIVQAITTAFAGPAQPAVEEEAATSAEIVADAPDLDALLALAHDSAIEAGEAEARTRDALHRSLSIAYDLAVAAEADPETLVALIADAGIRADSTPMMAVAKLVFGRNHDRKKLADYAAVLNHARRLCLAPGMLYSWLNDVEGGLKAIVAAERGERRPALKVDRVRSARMMVGSAPARAQVDLGTVDSDIVLLVARREDDGKLSILSRPIGERPLVDKALKHFIG